MTNTEIIMSVAALAQLMIGAATLIRACQSYKLLRKNEAERAEALPKTKNGAI